MTFTAVCSATPRPSVHNNHSKGHQWWARDPYHIRRSSDRTRTRCGRDCSEWLVIGEYEEPTNDCCGRCQSITNPAKQ
jgi:hypothetical protein